MRSTAPPKEAIQGWEEFRRRYRPHRVTRYISGRRCRDAGFERHLFSLTPDDGRMLLHTITIPDKEEAQELGLTRDVSLRFIVSSCWRLPRISQVDYSPTPDAVERYYRDRGQLRADRTPGRMRYRHKDEATPSWGQ